MRFSLQGLILVGVLRFIVERADYMLILCQVIVLVEKVVANESAKAARRAK